MYKVLKIDLTQNQFNNAVKGLPIRLSHSQLGKGDIKLALHPANAKIVEKAALKGCGCIIHVSPGELMSSHEVMEGKGFFGDLYKKLKSGYNWVKKNVIDSDVYQKNIKPVVKKAVDAGVMAASAAAAEAGYPQASIAIKAVTDKIGNETNAYGLKPAKKYTKKDKNDKLKAMGLYLT